MAADRGEGKTENGERKNQIRQAPPGMSQPGARRRLACLGASPRLTGRDACVTLALQPRVASEGVKRRCKAPNTSQPTRSPAFKSPLSSSVLRSPFSLWPVVLAFFVLQAAAQITPAAGDFPFIRQDRNLLLYSQPQALEPFFQSLDRLLSRGEGQVRIVHIGDSHIQADYFTGRVRERLHQYIPGSRAGRGFIFPYRVARTNSPPDYQVSYSGSWERCRNIDKDSPCHLGISGISVATRSTAAGMSIEFDPEWPVDYSFDRVRIFHSRGDESFEAAIGGVPHSRRRIDRRMGLTEFQLASPRNSLELRLERTSPQQSEFVLHGISLESQGPGILYHAMGVNGADAEAYLRCEYLGEHLEVLDPGLVIISLGTNDAMAGSFERNHFLIQMESLINRVRMAVPEAAILLTTPGDNCRRRRYLNRNNLQAREAILKAAQLSGGTVWDFFEVMGGLGSIRQWQNSNLSQRDRIHLTRPGYSLQGDLFFEALMRAYDGHLSSLAGTR